MSACCLQAVTSAAGFTSTTGQTVIKCLDLIAPPSGQTLLSSGAHSLESLHFPSWNVTKTFLECFQKS